MECKQPENVLLLMKVSFCQMNILLYKLLKLGIGIYISVKQVPSHVRSLGLHTWAKLTLFGIYISVKQVPSHVRSLRPHTWAKLTLFDIYISVK